MIATLIIPGRLDGLNALIDANRKSPFCGAKVKRDNDTIVTDAIAKDLKNCHFDKPVKIDFVWCEPNARRDPDNIASAKKFILDALVRSGVLENDTYKYVKHFTDTFSIDRDNPHILCTISDEGAI